MQGRDVVGIAQTGTGKTAAFALPILNRLIADPRPAPRLGARALVLAPTRELASQIAQSFRDLSAGLNFKIQVIFGGVPYGAQIRGLANGLDVLVATPGRLVDHLDNGHASLRHVEFFVLDEVDQMLDLGFHRQIRRVARELPKARQNLFFSATMPQEIRGLANELLRDPVEVAVTPVAKTADRVEQTTFLVDAAKKKDLLIELFADPDLSRTIVFTRTKRGADKVALALYEAGIDAVAIHGNKSQGQRERALAAFRGGQARALVATDIAARGIDIDDVSHVINFELPEVPEAYVHRIGRTARAGKAGQAFSLCDASERDQLRAIERLTRLRIETVERRGEKAPKALAPARKFEAPKVAAQKPRHRSAGPARPQAPRREDSRRPAQALRAAHAGRADRSSGFAPRGGNRPQRP